MNLLRAQFGRKTSLFHSNQKSPTSTNQQKNAKKATQPSVEQMCCGDLWPVIRSRELIAEPPDNNNPI
jgi:hypothetical protein